MKPDEMFIQTRLERFVPEGRCEMVSWIPAKMAIKDKIVDLKDSETGEWTKGWRVLSEPGNPMPLRVLRSRSQDHKKTRKASDV